MKVDALLVMPPRSSEEYQKRKMMQTTASVAEFAAMLINRFGYSAEDATQIIKRNQQVLGLEESLRELASLKLQLGASGIIELFGKDEIDVYLRLSIDRDKAKTFLTSQSITSFPQWPGVFDSDVPYIASESPVAEPVHDQADSGQIRGLLPMTEPKQKDDWFYAIRDCTQSFEEELRYTPSASELWSRLINNPPQGHGVQWDVKKRALVLSGKLLLKFRCSEWSDRIA